MKHHRYFLEQHWQLSFFIAALVFTISTLVEPYANSGLVKIIPIVILIIFCFRSLSLGFPKLFIFGLFFSMAGDFILNQVWHHSFIFGLSAFLIAHIFYISSLGRWNFHAINYLAVFAVFAIGTFSLILIYPNLEQLQLPVTAYMSILLLMSLATIFSEKSNFWLIAGGVSFLISDSLIGLNKFYTPITHSHLFIMASYYFAQYALVKGFFQWIQLRNTKV